MNWWHCFNAPRFLSHLRSHHRLISDFYFQSNKCKRYVGCVISRTLTLGYFPTEICYISHLLAGRKKAHTHLTISKCWNVIWLTLDGFRIFPVDSKSNAHTDTYNGQQREKRNGKNVKMCINWSNVWALCEEDLSERFFYVHCFGIRKIDLATTTPTTHQIQTGTNGHARTHAKTRYEQILNLCRSVDSCDRHLFSFFKWLLLLVYNSH